LKEKEQEKEKLRGNQNGIHFETMLEARSSKLELKHETFERE